MAMCNETLISKSHDYFKLLVTHACNQQSFPLSFFNVILNPHANYESYAPGSGCLISANPQLNCPNPGNKFTVSFN